MKRLIILLIFTSLITVIKAQPISQLPAASTLNPADLIPIVQSGVTKKIQAAKIVQFLADSLSNVRILSDSCLEVTYRGALDTMCFSQQDLNWIVTGNDIENSNTGDVTLKGQVYVPDIAASGAKYPGTIAGIGVDDRLFPLSIVNLYRDMIDTSKYLKTYGRENISTVGSLQETYSDFSTAVAAAGVGDVIDLSNAIFSATGTINLNANGTIIFQPGAMIIGTVTLVGDSTRIIAGREWIFGDYVTLSGTWIYDELYPEWVGADNTGIVNSNAAFIKMDSLLHDGATISYSGGTYMISSSVDWKIPRSNIKINGNNSTIIGTVQNAAIRINTENYVEEYYTNNFLTGLDSSVFIDVPGNEFVKGNTYVAIADSMDWKNLVMWKDHCKISVTTTDSSGSDSRYRRSITYTFNGFGEEDGNVVMYSLLPFPCDLAIDSILRDGGVQKINVYPLWEDIKISNLNTINCEFQISFVKNLIVENCNFSNTPLTQTQTRYGLWLNYTEGVKINHYTSEWINYPGLGYGIVFGASDNVLIDGFYLNNNRHGISISGFYNTTTNNVRVTNGTIINTNIDSHGNVFNVTVDGVKSYNGGSVLSSRGNGGTVMNCEIYNGNENSGGAYFYNVDPYDDDDIYVSNVVSRNSIAPVVKLNDSITSENVIVENCRLFMTDSIVGTDAIVVSNHGKFNNLYINNCYISTLKNDPGYFGYFDSLTTSKIEINNCYGENVTFGVYIGNSSLDTLIIKNSKLIRYNGVVQSLASNSPLFIKIDNNEFTNGDAILSIGSVNDSTHYDLSNNKFYSIARPIGGSPSKYTLKMSNNYFRGYYSTTSMLPTTTTNIVFMGNTIDVIDSTESQGYIADRGGSLASVTFKDELNFADSRATDVTMIVEDNIILAKLGTQTSNFTLTDGKLIFNRNRVAPVDGIFPNWWILFSNLDTASFIDNDFSFNNASLTRIFYALVNTTTAGRFYVSGNRVINKGATGQVFGAGSGWTGASIWYIGDQISYGFPTASTFGANSTLNYLESDFGSINLRNIASLGVYSDGNQLFRQPLAKWNGVAGAAYNVFIGQGAGKINPSDAGTDYNVGIGYSALAAADGANNSVAISRGALTAVTTGDYNIGIGFNAGGTNTTASYNVHIGRESGYNNGAAGNTSIGSYSLKGGAGATGTYNFAGGYNAGFSVTSGAQNVLTGYETGYSITTGTNNTSIGSQSMRLNQTGSANICFGYRAGYNELGSRKFYVAADSTSAAFGMRADSKLLMYGDMSNASKANHTLNIFAKTAIGSVTAPSYMLDITGDANLTGSYYLDGGEIISNVTEAGLMEVSTTNSYVNVNGKLSAGTLGRSPTVELEVNGTAFVNILKIVPQSAAPGSPTAGYAYFDSDDNMLKVWDGSTWQNCW